MAKYSRRNFTYFLLLLHLENFFCSELLLGYNAACNRRPNNFFQCDYNKFLVCDAFHCKCENPATMTFDYFIDSCVTKANQSCYLEEAWSRDVAVGRGQNALSSVKTARKTICVQGAICDVETNTCLCQTPLEADEFGYCRQHKSLKASADFNKRCSLKEEEKCAPNTGLKCIDGHCKCGVEFWQYFNGKKCISRVNGPCQTSFDCNGYAGCYKDKIHQRGRCKCISGYTGEADGHCSLAYRASCTYGDSHCSKHAGLNCVDGICKCPDELQVYSYPDNKCIGLPGAYCPIGKHPGCIQNSHCLQVNKEMLEGVCLCNEGYIETGNHTCILAKQNGTSSLNGTENINIQITRV